jgi:hypothetical protein
MGSKFVHSLSIRFLMVLKPSSASHMVSVVRSLEVRAALAAMLVCVVRGYQLSKRCLVQLLRT